MIEWFAGVQQLVLGGVLVWASTVKFRAGAASAARRSALRKLVGERHVVTAYRAVGAAELTLAALLLLPPVLAVESYAAVAMFAGMLAYLAYAKRKAPESGCGCLGDKQTPIRGRAFARTGVLLAAALATLGGAWWPAAFADRPLATVALVAAEAALVVALSPELDHRWLLPLRRWRVRVRHPLATGPSVVPLESSVQQLQKSDAYRSVVGALRSDLLDSWEEGEWRLLAYAATTPEGQVTAVFAVPLRDYRPDDVRVALVPDPEPAPV
ncbi:MAG TPA: MauE/DoxX family redox-associated membrane protein [Actinophytocola sp.]|nr:MauE/DoxX family redox-associated membrane protein [Actinophytocola sp.]